MANRSLRRPRTGDQSPPSTVIRNVPIQNIGIDDSFRAESESVEDAIGDSGADDYNVDGKPNSTERIGVVEIDPAKLGEYVNRDTTSNGDNSGSGNRTRRQRSDTGVKRGRKSKVQAAQDLAPIATMVSTWASVLLKTPELMLDKDEVKLLSESYATFAQHHTVPVMTEKRMSEVNLIVTVLALAGPRFVAIRNRKRSEQKTGNVTPINQQQSIRH